MAHGNHSFLISFNLFKFIYLDFLFIKSIKIWQVYYLSANLYIIILRF